MTIPRRDEGLSISNTTSLLSGLNPNLPGLGPNFGRDRSRSILMMNSKYDEDAEEDADAPIQVVKLKGNHIFEFIFGSFMFSIK